MWAKFQSLNIDIYIQQLPNIYVYIYINLEKKKEEKNKWDGYDEGSYHLLILSHFQSHLKAKPEQRKGSTDPIG